MVAPAYQSDPAGESKRATELIETSKQCVDIAESVSSDMSKKVDMTTAAACEKLKNLEVCAGELANYAEQFARTATKRKEEHQEQAQKIQREVASLLERVDVLKISEKNGKELLKNKESELSSAEQQLSDAETHYITAQGNLMKAKGQENDITLIAPFIGAAICGLAFPVALPGIIWGAFAGIPAAVVINEYLEAEKKALLEVKEYKEQVKRSQNAIDSIKDDIKKTSNEINTLSQQIRSKHEEYLKHNDEVKHIKEIAVSFHDAAFYWKTMQLAYKPGAALLRGINNEAKADESIVNLKSHEIKNAVMQFLKAWEDNIKLFVDKYNLDLDLVTED